MTRPRRGVTMIELVVVLVIIAIVSGVAAPAFLSVASRPQTATQQVANLIRSARARALEKGMVVMMTIDPSSRRFWLDRPDTTGTIDLPNGSALDGDTRVHFRFEPSGEVAADPLAVEDGGVLRQVHFDRWTGEVATGAR